MFDTYTIPMNPKVCKDCGETLPANKFYFLNRGYYNDSKNRCRKCEHQVYKKNFQTIKAGRIKAGRW